MRKKKIKKKKIDHPYSFMYDDLVRPTALTRRKIDDMDGNWGRLRGVFAPGPMIYGRWQGGVAAFNVVRLNLKTQLYFRIITSNRIVIKKGEQEEDKHFFF